MNFTRRRFLQGLLVAGTACLLPTTAAINQDKILVMIHLNGGNDGLNTVIPYRSELYRRLRPTLAVPTKEVLPLDNQLAFHPALEGLRELYEEGQLGVVLGVGYDNPNLSHFRSTEVWYSGGTEVTKAGWIGRAIDTRGTCESLTAAGIGHSPYSLSSSTGPAPDLSNPVRLAIPRQLAKVEKRYAQWKGRQGLAGQVGRAGQKAFQVSRELVKVRPADQPEGHGLARDLRLAVGLLEADLGIRYLQLMIQRFDTHDNQANQHAQLLERLSQALTGFQQELRRRGLAQKVVTVVFSEFGRRPQENSGGGTDHGTAGPVFVLGEKVRGGLHGRQPQLEDLVDGNLRHHVDFRQVYAGLLDSWCEVSPNQVVGRAKPLNLIERSA